MKLQFVAFLYANSGNTEKEIKKTNTFKKQLKNIV